MISNYLDGIILGPSWLKAVIPNKILSLKVRGLRVSKLVYSVTNISQNIQTLLCILEVRHTSGEDHPDFYESQHLFEHFPWACRCFISSLPCFFFSLTLQNGFCYYHCHFINRNRFREVKKMAQGHRACTLVLAVNLEPPVLGCFDLPKYLWGCVASLNTPENNFLFRRSSLLPLISLTVSL